MADLHHGRLWPNTCVPHDAISLTGRKGPYMRARGRLGYRLALQHEDASCRKIASHSVLSPHPEVRPQGRLEGEAVLGFLALSSPGRNLERGQDRSLIGTLYQDSASLAFTHRGKVEIDGGGLAVPACQLPQVAHDV